MSVIATARLLNERGLTVEQVIVAIKMVETRTDGAALIQAIVDGLEASNRIEQLGEFVEKICPILTVEPSPARRASYQRASGPCGPKERWGYDGPITPRLPERDWWPLRNAVVNDAGSTCHYCGDQHEKMCADHVVPLSRGGTNDRDNLVCCCIPCNSSKADRLLSEWAGRNR